MSFTLAVAQSMRVPISENRIVVVSDKEKGASLLTLVLRRKTFNAEVAKLRALSKAANHTAFEYAGFVVSGFEAARNEVTLHTA